MRRLVIDGGIIIKVEKIALFAIYFKVNINQQVIALLAIINL
jgi:hypothetical protein